MNLRLLPHGELAPQNLEEMVLVTLATKGDGQPLEYLLSVDDGRTECAEDVQRSE